jgi:GNAT superfamily N-acetyltransferase
MNIYPATQKDAQQILDFIIELAVYEKAEDEVVATLADIEKSLFSAGANAKAIMCEVNGEPAGYAVYFFNYSTWLGKNGLYLEDLYISPRFRGTGAGKAMLQHLAKIACDNDCPRFEWIVLDWNQPAIDFYQRIGAEPLPEWVKYRLSGEALIQFANEGKNT